MSATALAVADVAVAGLAQDAAAGDERAWRDLVARFEPLLRGIVRGYRLDPADVEDVVQVTWIRAFRSLDRLNEPAAIGAWLAITARREAMRTLQRGVRELSSELDMPLGSIGPTRERALGTLRKDAVLAEVLS